MVNREEAIKILKDLEDVDNSTPIPNKLFYEAFDMAIEALSEYEELKAKWIEAEQRADYYDMDGDDEASIDLISREDAIKELKKALSNDGDWYKEEACDIVETTLHDLPSVSEKPQSRVETSDLISRAEALEQMAQAECGLHYEDCEADNCSCPYIGRILNIPPIESNTIEWIPVSDRLPNTYEEVIVSIIDDSADSRLEETTVAWRLDEYWISGNDTIGEVVAWMPLPESYRGRGRK